MATLEELVVRIRADTRQLESELRRTGAVVDRSGKRMESSTQRASAAFINLRSVLATLGVTVVAREFVQLADTYRLITARLRLVTSGTAELESTMQRLVEISQSTRTDLESTATIFQRVARNADQIGATTDDVLKFTETLQQLVIVSGAAPQEARNAIIQLSQGLASGELRGEELRSVMEQLPAVARAAADEMNLTLGEFRERSMEGEVTAEAFFNAILQGSEKANREFEKMPVTVGQATTKIGNSMMVLVGTFDDVTGSTAGLASMLSEVSDGLIDISDWVDQNADSVRDALTFLEGAFTTFPFGAAGGARALLDQGDLPEGFAAPDFSAAGFAGVGIGETSGEGGGGGPSDEAKKRIEKIKNAIADLRFEVEQFGRSEFEQKVSEAIRGADAEGTKFAETIRGLTLQLDVLEDNKAFQDQIDDLREGNRELQLRLAGREDEIEFLRIENQLREKLGRELLPIEREQLERILETRRDLNDSIEEQQDVLRELEGIADSVGRGLEDAFVAATSGASKGFEDMGDIALSVLQDIQRALFRILVTRPLGNALDQALGGSGGIGNALSSFFTSGGGGSSGPLIPANPFGPASNFASGGRPPVGRPSIVGESGPEVFVPDVSGTIMSNSALRGGGSDPVVINMDLRGSNGDAAIEQAVRKGIRQATPAIVNASVNKTVDQRGRGKIDFGPRP